MKGFLGGSILRFFLPVYRDSRMSLVALDYYDLLVGEITRLARRAYPFSKLQFSKPKFSKAKDEKRP
jgi:hypothetical protein